jgi:hypothetical protein
LMSRATNFNECALTLEVPAFQPLRNSISWWYFLRLNTYRMLFEIHPLKKLYVFTFYKTYCLVQEAFWNRSEIGYLRRGSTIFLEHNNMLRTKKSGGCFSTWVKWRPVQNRRWAPL